MGTVTDKIQTESDARSKSFDIDDAFSKTGMEMTIILAGSGSDGINFNFTNTGGEKLWDYRKFDLFITYDANIAGSKTRVTEVFTYNSTAAFLEVAGPPIGPTQFARPDGTVSGTGWATGDHTDIDEVSRDDADFTTSLALGKNDIDVWIVTQSDVTDPQTSDNHFVNYTFRQGSLVDNDVILDVKLLQGATVIASWTESSLTASFQQSNQTLSTAQADSITNYNDLRLNFTAICDSACNNGGPNTDFAEVSWAQVGVPGLPGLVSIDGLLAKEWTINRISNDNLDPRIVNSQENAQVVCKLSYPIFSNGFLQISINSDNGKVERDSIIVT